MPAGPPPMGIVFARTLVLLNGGALGCLIVAAGEQLGGEHGDAVRTGLGDDVVARLDGPGVAGWLFASAALVAGLASISIMDIRGDPAARRLGAGLRAAVTLSALACMAMAAIRHHQAGGTRYVDRPLGGTDFTGFFQTREPGILPWIVAAATLTVFALAAGVVSGRRQ